MEEANTPQPDADSVGSKPGALQLARRRLKHFGPALASIAAVGAIVGGLAGFLNAWTAIKSNFLHVAAPAMPGSATISKGPTVAVLPFANETGDPARDAFASGLTQDTVAALSRFTALRVLAHGGDATVDYVVDGDLRKGGDSLRASFRLTDARTGAQIWSRGFDANPKTRDVLSLQDEIAGRAAAIIGSFNSGIAAAEAKRVQTKPIGELTPYECIVQGVVAGVVAMSMDAPMRGRACLEALVAKEPGNAAAWAALSNVYINQRFWALGLPAEQVASLRKRDYLVGKTLAAATKAVELAPDDAYVRRALAGAYYLSCQRDRLRTEAQRAIALNPNDANVIGMLGNWIAFAGDWDSGAQMAERGIAMLAPAAPRSWSWAEANRHWLRGEYEQAHQAFEKGYIELNWLSHLQMAYTLPFLGRIDEAKAEIARVEEMKPGFTIREADFYFRAWCFDSAARDKIADALRKTGLPE